MGLGGRTGRCTPGGKAWGMEGWGLGGLEEEGDRGGRVRGGEAASEIPALLLSLCSVELALAFFTQLNSLEAPSASMLERMRGSHWRP